MNNAHKKTPASKKDSTIVLHPRIERKLCSTMKRKVFRDERGNLWKRVPKRKLYQQEAEFSQDKRMAELRLELLQAEINEFESRTEENKKKSKDHIALVKARLQRSKQKIKAK